MEMYTVLLLQSGSNDSSGAVCCIGFVVVVIVGLVLIVKSANETMEKQKRALNDAHTAYQNSLKELKSDPRNADLRQRTLNLGRAYSNLTRNKSGVTVYDEMALMNDINAACAAAGGSVSKPATPDSASSIESRLAKLADLKSKSLINEDEYNSRRQKILDEV